MSDDDDKNMVVMSNGSKGGTQSKASTAELSIFPANETETMFNTLYINIAMDMAIADAGATGHFLMPETQVTNLEPSNKSLTINLPMAHNYNQLTLVISM